MCKNIEQLILKDNSTGNNSLTLTKESADLALLSWYAKPSPGMLKGEGTMSKLEARQVGEWLLAFAAS